MNQEVARDLSKAGSLRYRDAGLHLRQVIARATRARLNGTQWRVLGAVVSSTLSYSKRYDRTFVARIAEMADLDRKDPRSTETRRALRHLAKTELISYEPGRKDGAKTLIGILPTNPHTTGTRGTVDPLL
jgi:hypothetical protein